MSESSWKWLIGRRLSIGIVVDVFEGTATVLHGDDETRILISELLEEDYKAHDRVDAALNEAWNTGDAEIDALNAKIDTLIQQNWELEKALDLLDAVYGMYEDGITCYEEPDDYGGYVGMAIHIPEDVENEIVDLLNKHKPRQPLG